MTNEEITTRIQSGERELVSTLWENNVGLIALKARRFYNYYRDRCTAHGVTADDFIQVGYFALLDAVNAYDASTGYKLTTYLNFPLMKHFKILAGFTYGGDSRKSDPLNKSISLNDEIGENSGIERIEALVDPESEKPFEDVENSMFRSELRDTLEKAISNIPPRYAEVIRKRFFESQTLQKIADESGLTIEGIRQRGLKGFKLLRCEKELKELHDKTLIKWAYRATGLQSFKNTFISSVEMAVIKAEAVVKAKSKAEISVIRAKSKADYAYGNAPRDTSSMFW